MFFEKMDLVKQILIIVLAVLAVVFCLSLLFGGFLFDLDPALIASWFTYIIVFVFLITFIGSVIAFICWFLGVSPFPEFKIFIPVLVFVVAIIVVFVATFFFAKLLPTPFAKFGDMILSIFSFLNK